jgi:hypothetical protein
MGDRGPVIVTLVVGAALLGLVVVALRAERDAPPSTTEGSPTDAGGEEPPTQADELPLADGPRPLRKPPKAVAELALLSERPENELERWSDVQSLGRLLGPRWCGDEATCAAVRAVLEDPERTRVDVMSAWDYRLERVHPAEVATGLSTKDRARLEALVRASTKDAGRTASVLVVDVTGAAMPQELPARTAFAVAGALAERLDALVYDELVDRVELPRGFAAHAITSGLDASAFRRDCMDVQAMRRDDGTTRLLTVGLERYGVPDVDVREASDASLPVLRELLFEVAEDLVNGEPPPIRLVSVDPEEGDPNDFMARVVPPGGGFSADDYDALAEELDGDGGGALPK